MFSILIEPDMDINYDVILGLYSAAAAVCGLLYVCHYYLGVEAIEGFWLVVSSFASSPCCTPLCL